MLEDKQAKLKESSWTKTLRVKAYWPYYTIVFLVIMLAVTNLANNNQQTLTGNIIKTMSGGAFGNNCHTQDNGAKVFCCGSSLKIWTQINVQPEEYSAESTPFRDYCRGKR